jgi:hypothetical protein
MSFLFDVSPTEDQATRRRAKAKRPEAAAPRPAPVQDAVIDESEGFLASLEQVPCQECGAPADLAQVLLINGKKKWRVQCGWWCLHSWLIDPIPGVLDPKPEKKKEFVMREGRFAGKTFAQAWDEGGEWHIRALAELSPSKRLAAAAAEFLATKSA